MDCVYCIIIAYIPSLWKFKITKNSNNSKSLFIAALSKYKNKKVFFVENEDELNKKDLLGLSNIAVASGTSTPDFVVKRIAKYLTSI